MLFGNVLYDSSADSKIGYITTDQEGGAKIDYGDNTVRKFRYHIIEVMYYYLNVPHQSAFPLYYIPSIYFPLYTPIGIKIAKYFF